MDKIFSISFLLLFMSGILIVVLRLKMESILESRHPDVWGKLGCPKLIKAASKLEENDRFISYFSNKNYLELGDVNLNNIAFAASLLSKIGIVLTFFTAVLGVYLWAL